MTPMLNLRVSLRSAFASTSRATFSNSSLISAKPTSSPPAVPTPSAPANAEISSLSSKSTSSCPPGTRMTGLNHTKAGSDPIALEENEYPSWLWTLVDGAAGVKGGKKSKGNVEATPAEITREMRKQGKIAIKARNDLKN